jgi:hypothetical protein
VTVNRYVISALRFAITGLIILLCDLQPPLDQVDIVINSPHVTPDPRLGRRMALTLPLLPPPQKN